MNYYQKKELLIYGAKKFYGVRDLSPDLVYSMACDDRFSISRLFTDDEIERLYFELNEEEN